MDSERHNKKASSLLQSNHTDSSSSVLLWWQLCVCKWYLACVCLEPSWPGFVSKCWVYLLSIQCYALLHSVKQGRIQLHGGRDTDKSSLLFQSAHGWMWGWGVVELQPSHHEPPKGNEVWGGGQEEVGGGTDRLMVLIEKEFQSKLVKTPRPQCTSTARAENIFCMGLRYSSLFKAISKASDTKHENNTILLSRTLHTGLHLIKWE